jgi:flagellar basal body-associated protein FliL
VVFTIRTYVAALEEMTGRDPHFVDTLLASLDSAPPATLAYKGWTGVAKELRDTIEDQLKNA